MQTDPRVGPHQPWMWVKTDMASPDGGWGNGDQWKGVEWYVMDKDLWQPRAPTQIEEASHGGTHARNGERLVGGQKVETSRDLFMASLGRGKRRIKGGSRVMGNHNCLGLS